MHFVDRSAFENAPIEELASLHAEEQGKWVLYKMTLKTHVGTANPKPGSKWNKDSIRDALTNLFHNNCAYCGDYSDKNHDGEVDHFFPKELDEKAELIYSWNNYVWACHSCNNKKRSHYPLIDPCHEEVNNIIFHSLDGRYVIKLSADETVQKKFELTEKQTFLNGKKRPERRLLISKHLVNIHLQTLFLRYQVYELERSVDPNSAASFEHLEKLNDAKHDLKQFLETSDFVLLKMKLFHDFLSSNPSFIYSYNDFV